MPHHSILAIAYRLGSERITYDDIATRFGAEAAAKVLKGSGIRNRYVAAKGVCGSDLALGAAEELVRGPSGRPRRSGYPHPLHAKSRLFSAHHRLRSARKIGSQKGMRQL